MKKVNFHTHTAHCGHASGDACDFAKTAFENKLETLGFSDHAPFADFDYGCRMPYSELDQYCAEVEIEKEKYKGKMDIICGLEIEYLPEYTKGSNYYESLLTEKLDYLILGEHFFRDRKGCLHNITSIERPELVVDYALACKEAMETGYFKVLCHPDLCCINNFKWDDNYEKACDILIEASLKTKVPLELNANGYRRGINHFVDGDRYQYPHDKLWTKIAKAQTPCIVGADAHNPSLIWDKEMDKAYAYLKKLGLQPLDHL